MEATTATGTHLRLVGGTKVSAEKVASSQDVPVKEELIAISDVIEDDDAVLRAEYEARIQQQRAAKVQRLKKKVLNGTYQPDIRDLALILVHDGLGDETVS